MRLRDFGRLLCLALALSVGGKLRADEAGGAFIKPTIDLGMVVSDVDKSLKFYKDAIGFEELPGFSVPADAVQDAGLSTVQIDIHVLALGKGDNATKLKLMQVAGVESKPGDNAYIHSQYGFRYLTIFVTDTAAAVARLKQAGVTPIAKTPLEIPKTVAPGMWLTVIRDPDGNLVELVGPKK